MWSSHKTRTCNFTGLCRSIYRVSEFLQSSLLRESTKMVIWIFECNSDKQSLKISKLGVLSLIIFFTWRIECNTSKLMTSLATDQLLNTRSRNVQFWAHYFLTLMWLIFYINLNTVILKITLMIQLPIRVPLTFPLSTSNYSWP